MWVLTSPNRQGAGWGKALRHAPCTWRTSAQDLQALPPQLPTHPDSSTYTVERSWGADAEILSIRIGTVVALRNCLNDACNVIAEQRCLPCLHTS